MENNSDDSEKVLLDVAPMRRFAMATGTVLWAYLVAGGVPAKEWKSTLIPLEITHPEFLVIFFLAVSVYASWRYWYFGVHLSLTRTKIRQYLKSSESILVFSAGVQLQIPLISTRNPESQLQGVLRNKLLPGMQENEFLFFSDTNPGETQSDTVRFLVAHKLQKYFPGLQPDDITPRNAHTSTANYIYWAHVSSLGSGTRVTTALEDFDLYAPVTINALGIIGLIASRWFCWPSVRCVLGG